MTLTQSWRHVLAHDVPNARPIVTTLLKGRVTYEPTATRNEWILRGEGTLIGLFEKVFALGGTSPTAASWNQIASWLKAVDALRQAA